MDHMCQNSSYSSNLGLDDLSRSRDNTEVHDYFSTCVNSAATANGTLAEAEFLPAPVTWPSTIQDQVQGHNETILPSGSGPVPLCFDQPGIFRSHLQNQRDRTTPEAGKITTSEKETALDDDYILQPTDVLCLPRGPQGSGSEHPGNKRFRVLVMLEVERYQKANSSHERARIGREIVRAVRRSGANFVRKKNGSDGRWHDIGNRKAREKVRHALRAAAHDQRLEKRSDRARGDIPTTGSRGATTNNSNRRSELLLQQALPVSQSSYDCGIQTLPLPLDASSPLTESDDFREFVQSTSFLTEGNDEPDDWLSVFDDHSSWSDSVGEDQNPLFDPIMFV